MGLMGLIRYEKVSETLVLQGITMNVTISGSNIARISGYIMYNYYLGGWRDKFKKSRVSAEIQI